MTLNVIACGRSKKERDYEYSFYVLFQQLHNSIDRHPAPSSISGNIMWYIGYCMLEVTKIKASIFRNKVKIISCSRSKKYKVKYLTSERLKMRYICFVACLRQEKEKDHQCSYCVNWASHCNIRWTVTSLDYLGDYDAPTDVMNADEDFCIFKILLLKQSEICSF